MLKRKKPANRENPRTVQRSVKSVRRRPDVYGHIDTFDESVGGLEALGDRLDATADEGHFKAIAITH